MPDSTLAAAAPRPSKPSHAAEQLVLATIRDHAEPLLRVARRHSLCADDAFDAYQRALEIFLRNADRLDPERAPNWLYTVCKHEAMAVRRQRQALVGGEEAHIEALESRTTPSPEEQVISAERVARSAEALRRLKPQEVRALWLRAEGRSYQEICEATSWTYTKVNRCLAEGRASFLAKYAGIESGEECDRLAPALSALVDGEALPEQLVELRAHLRHCGGCRAAVRELHDAARPIAVVLPGLVLAGAPGSLLERLHAAAHGLGHALHERAVALATRAQALLDAAPAAKVAAVAASAAAVAGGGAVVVADVAQPRHAHRVVRARPVAVPGSVPATVAPVVEVEAPVVRASHHRTAAHRKRARSMRLEQRPRAPAPLQAAPSATASEPAPSSQPSGAEFGFEAP